MAKIAGHKVLVCGASQGIGQAVAKNLASQGAELILLARRQNVLDELKKNLVSAEIHQTVAVDLSDLQAVEKVAVQLAGHSPEITMVVLNTGGPKGGDLIEASPQELERAFRQHVLSSQILLRALVPGMKRRRIGRIVSILSTSVRMPIVGLGVSNTIRSAMAGYMKTLSLELGPFGITANNILPGFTETPRLQSLQNESAERSGRDPMAVQEQWLKSVPIGRLIQPQETAEAVAFLLQSDAISGVSLQVDGGRIGSI